LRRKEHKHKKSRTLEICECGAARERGKEWGEFGGPWLGRALHQKLLDGSTPEERSEVSRRASVTRWAGRKKERKEYMQGIASLPRPSRRREHCPCGAMTLERAEKRGHKCDAPQPKEAA
jgi:hypothetical protein